MIDGAEAVAPALADPETYNRNVLLLSQRAPTMKAFLEAGRCAYTVSRTQEGTIYRDQAGASVLGGPDPAYSLERMDAFLKAPERMFVTQTLRSVPADPEYWAEHLAPDLVALDRGALWARSPDLTHAPALVMIDQSSSEALLKALEALPDLLVLVLIVRDIDLFNASLHAMDWAGVLRTCDQRGIQLRLLPMQAPATTCGLAQKYLSYFTHILPDNIALYAHMDSPIHRDIVRRMKAEWQGAIAGTGFFRDEVCMYEGTADNLLEHDRPLLVSQPAHDGTALIVGSGPSLDKTIETVRALSETCFVIACGSAVEPLRERGIRVDACTIIERGRRQPKLFKSIAERVDLSDVTMIASSTVEPDVQPCFKDGYYFFRPGLSTVKGFGGGGEHTLSGCDPTVSNLGVSTAVFLGFRKLVLCGVDYGSVDAAVHHSANTLYFRETDSPVDLDPKFNLRTPATFGGMMQTNFVFSWARQSMGNMVTAGRDFTVYNLSDGAIVPGSVPLTPDTLGALTRVFPVGTGGRDITLKSKPFNRERYFYDLMVMDGFVRRLRAIFETLSWRNRRDIVASLTVVLWTDQARHPFQMIFRGTLTRMLWAVLGALSRMTETERARHEPNLRVAVLASLDGMAQELDDLIRHGIRRLDRDDPRRM